MAVSIIKLKKKAISLGMKKSEAQAADRDSLEEFISENGSGKSAPAKKKAVAKKKSSTTAAKKTSAAKKPATTTAAKSSAKKTTTRKSAKADDSGRAAIGKLDYTVESEDWNPKKGSPVELIWRSLKKNRDNTEKVFDDLKGDVYDFVGKTKRDGTKRTKEEALAMLRYRINRTRFEFATRTGQHSVATNRVKYGEGAYAQETKKAKRSAARKSSTKKKK